MKGCPKKVSYFWNTHPRIPPTTSEETIPPTHQMTFCWPDLISLRPFRNSVRPLSISCLIWRIIIPTSRNVLGSSSPILPPSIWPCSKLIVRKHTSTDSHSEASCRTCDCSPNHRHTKWPLHQPFRDSSNTGQVCIWRLRPGFEASS